MKKTNLTKAAESHAHFGRRTAFSPRKMLNSEGMVVRRDVGGQDRKCLADPTRAEVGGGGGTELVPESLEGAEIGTRFPSGENITF